MHGLDAAFWNATVRSLIVALSVGLLSLCLGWRLGVRVRLTTFKGRGFLLTALALPLLLPSFLTAIGLSLLSPQITGFLGTVWTFTCTGLPLVTFASLAATYTITRSQADAARLAGGERLLFSLAVQA